MLVVVVVVVVVLLLLLLLLLLYIVLGIFVLYRVVAAFFGVLSLLSFRKQNRSCLVQVLMLEKPSFLPGTYLVESTPWRWLRRFCRVDLYFIPTHTLEMDGTGLIS